MPLDDARFDLPDATRELRDVALAFACDKLAPHAHDWDERRHLPVDTLREAAGLGMAALYVWDEGGVGDQGLRVDEGAQCRAGERAGRRWRCASKPLPDRVLRLPGR